MHRWFYFIKLVQFARDNYYLSKLLLEALRNMLTIYCLSVFKGHIVKWPIYQIQF